MRRVPWILATAIVGAAGCSGLHALPDRTDPAVRQAEAELAERIGSEHGGATCDVRLLGREGNESYVWATCMGPSSGGVSAPMLVTDAEITVPRDGSLFAEDVRSMFPPDLASLVLDNTMQVRP